MIFLDSILQNDTDFNLLLNDVKKARLPLCATGLSLIHKSAIISSVKRLTKSKISVISKDEAEALSLLVTLNL